MKTVVFINFPVSGHVNPQYSLCEELAKKNVRLIYFTAECYSNKYESIPNIEIIKYPKEFMDYYSELSNDIKLHEKMMALMYVFNTFTERILPFTVSKLKEIKPDLIICDSLAVWGKSAARYLDIPYCIFFSSFMGDPIIMKKTPLFTFNLIKSGIVDFKYVVNFMKIKKRIEKKYGNVCDPMPKIMHHQGKFTIVATSKKFHPGGDLYPKNVNFVRPDVFNDKKITQKKDTIFISVGTISFSSTFWDICLEATKNLNYRVVLSFGNNKNNKISSKNIRDNVFIYDNLSHEDFRRELERSELFITHGGFNSITDGIVAETKLLVCPITSEQAGNGQILERYGCGKLFNEKNITPEKLEKEIKQLLNNKKMKNRLRYYKQSFINEQTYSEIVDKMNKEFNLY